MRRPSRPATTPQYSDLSPFSDVHRDSLRGPGDGKGGPSHETAHDHIASQSVHECACAPRFGDTAARAGSPIRMPPLTSRSPMSSFAGYGERLPPHHPTPTLFDLPTRSMPVTELLPVHSAS